MKTKVMQRPRKNSSEIEVLSRNVGVRGRRDRIFDGMIYVILFLVAFSILFPMLFVISASLTPYTEVMRNGGFLVIPRVISFDAYETLFQKSTLSIVPGQHFYYSRRHGTQCFLYGADGFPA